MEILDKISKLTVELNPIVQGLIGSAIFSLAIFIGRIVWNWLLELNKANRIRRDREQITKIILHKCYVNHNGMYYFTQGYLQVIFRAAYHLLRALIFYFSSLGILRIIDFQLIGLIGVYFCVQELLSGLSWVNPSWGVKDLNKYDPTLKNEIIDQFKNKDPLTGDNKKMTD